VSQRALLSRGAEALATATPPQEAPRPFIPPSPAARAENGRNCRRSFAAARARCRGQREVSGGPCRARGTRGWPGRPVARPMSHDQRDPRPNDRPARPNRPAARQPAREARHDVRLRFFLLARPDGTTASWGVAWALPNARAQAPGRRLRPLRGARQGAAALWCQRRQSTNRLTRESTLRGRAVSDPHVRAGQGGRSPASSTAGAAPPPAPRVLDPTDEPVAGEGRDVLPRRQRRGVRDQGSSSGLRSTCGLPRPAPANGHPT
jgi:hypothetical protein